MGKRASRGKADTKVSGCVLIDKPAGCTSHDIVDQVRNSLGTRKVGHAGTLDPDATGILVLGVGLGTKLLEFVVGADKSYEGQVVFGTETSTLDAAGEIIAEYTMDVDLEKVKQASRAFLGESNQIPPMVSAIKIDGKRLHELHRKGIEVERPARAITIESFEVSATKDPLCYNIAISCSSGTYIRSIAADLGKALGGGAHLSGLRRTRVGPFSIEDATAVADLQLLDPEVLLKSVPIIEVDDQIAKQVRSGQSLGPSNGDGHLLIKSSEGDLLAVYEARDGELLAAKILPQESI